MEWAGIPVCAGGLLLVDWWISRLDERMRGVEVMDIVWRKGFFLRIRMHLKGFHVGSNKGDC